MCVYVCVCAHSCVHVLICLRLFATPWIVAHQAPLSMEFSRQEYWSELPFPTLGDLPDPGIKPGSLATPVLAGQFFITEPPGNLPANAGDAGLIPGSERPPGEGNDYPLQYSCLGNPMDRGAWWATVHRVTKSQT